MLSTEEQARADLTGEQRAQLAADANLAAVFEDLLADTLVNRASPFRDHLTYGGFEVGTGRMFRRAVEIAAVGAVALPKAA